MASNFDIDKYLLNAKYSEVKDNSAGSFFAKGDRPPTMYSPDRK